MSAPTADYRRRGDGGRAFRCAADARLEPRAFLALPMADPPSQSSLRRGANLHTIQGFTKRLAMKLTRSSRVLAAWITLFCLLFTQLAVAAYVCPQQKAAQSSVGAGAAPMVDCQEMGLMLDMDQPGLCKAHCESGQQSLDTPGAPHVQPFVAAGLALVLVDATGQHTPAPGLGAIPLTRTTAPPLAIRHCCFRI